MPLDLTMGWFDYGAHGWLLLSRQAPCLTDSSADHHPQAMLSTVEPLGSTIRVGAGRLSASPVPSWPHLPQPQAKDWPQAL